jgi:hypothetical protein
MEEKTIVIIDGLTQEIPLVSGVQNIKKAIEEYVTV